MNTEKAKSESIIFPILTEAKRRAGLPANILSGVAFDVDRASGLSGFCDFLISRSESNFITFEHQSSRLSRPRKKT